MRKLSGELRRWIRLRGPGLMVLLLLWGGVPVSSQLQESQQLPMPPAPGGRRGPFGRAAEDEPGASMSRAQKEAAKRRNIDRHKRLVADSDRILQAAQALRSAIELTGQNQSAPAIAKRAEEIEKLAKSVKDRMKAE